MERGKEKQGFVLYFDSYPILAALSPEQRGWLLSVLFTYAEQVCREEAASLEEVLEQRYPALEEQTRVACGFMGAYILRDTQRWHSQRELRAQRRQEQGRRGPAQPVPANPERERADMDLTLRLMREMEEQDAAQAPEPKRV